MKAPDHRGRRHQSRGPPPQQVGMIHPGLDQVGAQCTQPVGQAHQPPQTRAAPGYPQAIDRHPQVRDLRLQWARHRQGNDRGMEPAGVRRLNQLIEHDLGPVSIEAGDDMDEPPRPPSGRARMIRQSQRRPIVGRNAKRFRQTPGIRVDRQSHRGSVTAGHRLQSEIIRAGTQEGRVAWMFQGLGHSQG